MSSIALAGGGSGGHLLPAVAVAKRFLQCAPDGRALFLTSDRAIDQKLLAANGFPDHRTTWIPLSVQSHRTALKQPWQFLRQHMQAFRVARRAIQSAKPDVVLGMGGFASIPGVLAAKSLGVPVVLMEQNTIPGRATRGLARISQAICSGLPLSQSTTQFRCPVYATGIPVRPDFLAPADPPAHPTSDTPHVLLVIGGSQGARSVNQLVSFAVQQPNMIPDGWGLVHQTGEAELSETRQSCRQFFPAAHVTPLITDMAAAFTRATLIVSRAGATTLAELACIGRPAILIPHSGSADHHQLSNARWAESQDAAVVVEEGAADSPQRFTDMLRLCLRDAGVREQLANNMRKLAKPDAADDVLRIMWQQVG